MRVRAWLTGVAIAAVAGCALPPVTTPEESFSIPYNTLLPPGVTLVLGVPPFADQKAPATTLPVPKEARAVKLNTVTLNLKLQNTGPVPLRIRLYLSAEAVDPYSTTPLGGPDAQIELPPNSPAEVAKSFPLDPTLLTTNEKLKLGYTFGSPGTTQPVTTTGDDKVLVKYSVQAAVKVF